MPSQALSFFYVLWYTVNNKQMGVFILFMDYQGQNWYKVGLHLHTTLSDGKKTPEEAAEIYEKAGFDVNLEPASGPRHICFSKDGRFAYLINEISGKVTTLSYDGKCLTPIQYIEADTVNAQGSADIHLSPDGKFLYASNRLKADGIAIFSVNQETGLLTKAGYQLTGIHPRNFVMTPDGKYLLVACRDSNVVQIFSRDKETGLLVDTGKRIETSKPVCLKFI